ncbi:hypothetical protein [Bradyrhizobium sp. AS23.2]|uniref:hypothetical protein n=1 Tax=Bradyrhizobium sp. AS23.2 TaxID=1680155 RepID=UPI00116127A3|nr:hypothetical protein [Bradyrhizobium sp. AS23.2]
MQQIVSWSEAYPLDIFPEPDLKRAAELLKRHQPGRDLCMRHVIEGVGNIARDGLGGCLPALVAFAKLRHNARRVDS